MIMMMMMRGRKGPGGVGGELTSVTFLSHLTQQLHFPVDSLRPGQVRNLPLVTSLSGRSTQHSRCKEGMGSRGQERDSEKADEGVQRLAEAKFVV